MKLSTLLFAGLTALLGGCVAKLQPVTPEMRTGMMADLRAGKLTLDCGERCRGTWNGHVAETHALDIAEKWPDLTLQVMTIRYGNDLAYYYLGQAAQGLGYHKVAIDYYTYALGLSRGPNAALRCEAGRSAGSDPCQGVEIATAIPVLIAASRTVLEREAPPPAPPPSRHHRRHRRPAAPASTGTSDSGGANAGPGSSAGSSSGGVTGTGTGGNPPGWVAPPPTPPQ